jgi:hypothetical protein
MPLMRDKKGQNLTKHEKRVANNHVRMGYIKIIRDIDKVIEKDFHFLTDEELLRLERILKEVKSLDERRTVKDE